MMETHSARSPSFTTGANVMQPFDPTPTDQVILATGGYDHTIRFWSAFNGQCVKTVNHPESQVNALEITPDRLNVAAAGYQSIRVYDIQSSNTNPITIYEGIPKNATALGFQENGSWMYASGEDGTIKIWDAKHRNHQPRIFQTKSPINCCCLNPNQIELIAGDQAGNIHIWDIRGDKSMVFEVDPTASIQHISTYQTPTNNSGLWLSAVDNKGNCYILKSGPSGIKKGVKIQAHQKYALKCRFSPDSTLLVTTSADHTAKIWRTSDVLPLTQKDPDEGKLPDNSCSGWQTSDNLSPLIELTSQKQRWVWDCAFTLDSQYLITGSSDTNARLWNVNTGEIQREYNGHQKAVTAIAFSDGTNS